MGRTGSEGKDMNDDICDCGHAGWAHDPECYYSEEYEDYTIRPCGCKAFKRAPNISYQNTDLKKEESE